MPPVIQRGSSCHKLWEMPRPLHQTVAFVLILSNGGTSTAASTVSSTVEKLDNTYRRWLMPSWSTSASQTTTAWATLSAEKGKPNLTRHHFGCPSVHGIPDLHCPIREADGFVPARTRKSAARCKKWPRSTLSPWGHTTGQNTRNRATHGSDVACPLQRVSHMVPTASSTGQGVGLH